MKRLLIILSAGVVLTFGLLLQLDLIALFRLSVAGIYDAPTTMYFLWVFPIFFDVGYEILKDSLLVIILISDLFLLCSGGLVYWGIVTEEYPRSTKYHF